MALLSVCIISAFPFSINCIMPSNGQRGRNVKLNPDNSNPIYFRGSMFSLDLVRMQATIFVLSRFLMDNISFFPLIGLVKLYAASLSLKCNQAGHFKFEQNTASLCYFLVINIFCCPQKAQSAINNTNGAKSNNSNFQQETGMLLGSDAAQEHFQIIFSFLLE